MKWSLLSLSPLPYTALHSAYTPGETDVRVHAHTHIQLIWGNCVALTIEAKHKEHDISTQHNTSVVKF